MVVFGAGRFHRFIQAFYSARRTNLRLTNGFDEVFAGTSFWSGRCVSSQPYSPPHLSINDPNWKQQQRRKDNIFLMGYPGSGKTSLANLVGKKLGIPSIDVDDDILEKKWNMSVAQKLQNVGAEQFLLEEGEALTQLQVENSIISLSGSNPLHQQSMQHIQELGIVVYLDVKQSDILHRLNKMKVDRIVGQTDGTSMSDILKYRQQFYENYYDIRVICREGESLDSIAEKVTDALSLYNDAPSYVSTRGSDNLGFNEAVLQGLANDGGLFVPDTKLPKLGQNELMRLVPLNYRERALRILEMLIPPQAVHPSMLRQYVDKAFSEDKFGSSVCQIVPTLNSPRSECVVELFRGPSGSFKDLALQLMPHLFHHAAQSQQSNKTRYLILVATSGDTGSAVAQGFQSLVGDGSVKVLILYPENGISSVQKIQMLLSQNENVSVVGVDGDFDFCQGAIKSILNSQKISGQLLKDFNVKLSVANSVNWARLVTQIVYHISAYLDTVAQNIVPMGQQVDVAIPTGNFGNTLSAVYAKQMGLPIRKMICASNSNNVLTEFINTGHYNLAGRRLFQTTSPAIDILMSSNIERYIYSASNRSSVEVRQFFQQLKENGRFKVSPQVLESMRYDFWADWCMESSCFDSIHDVYKKTGYLLDPHTAVAMAVSKKFANPRGQVPLLVCATAHYAKFPSTVLEAITKSPAVGSTSEMLQKLEELCPNPPSHTHIKNVANSSVERHLVLPADLSSIVSHIRSMF